VSSVVTTVGQFFKANHTQVAQSVQKYIKNITLVIYED